MKRIFFLFFILLEFNHGFSRTPFADSIHAALLKPVSDSVRYDLLHRLYAYYEETQKDSALLIIRRMLVLAEQNNQLYSQAVCLGGIGYELMGLGNFSESLNSLMKAKGMCDDESIKVKNTWSVQGGTIGTEPPQKFKRLSAQAYIFHILGTLMWNTGNISQSAVYFRNARDIAVRIDNKVRIGMASMNLGRCYIYQGKPDSGLLFQREAESIALKVQTSRYLGSIYTYLGNIALSKKQDAEALLYYRKAIAAGRHFNNLNSLAQAYYSTTQFFLNRKNFDSSLFYAKATIEVVKKLGSSFSLLYINAGTVYENLYKSYLLSGNGDSIARYEVLMLRIKDSLNVGRIKQITDFQNSLFQNQIRLQSLEKQKLISDSRYRTNLFIAGLAFVVAVSMLLYRNNLVKKRDNKVLQQTLDHLKATQAQLVQAEKMASLGELTAGIAHEIQNPLNFVNNFSEVSKELLEEMKEELAIGNWQSANEIASDVEQNLEKIHHHGKRADAIVKGMLQHSRASTGQREPTDINALCNEYLRLAYHGLKAKDQSFEASFRFEPDATLPLVSVVPQDIGRALLNLINNAFQAVDERVKSETANVKGDSSSISTFTFHFEPQVTVSTKKLGDRIEISVEDNGPGIPDAIKDKIFQPFFTTKPTGQGTGLGLSLSYDIVKAHGGEIKVNTKEKEGTRFTIQLTI